MDAWGVSEAFYSFDFPRLHFVVLDCNFVKTAEGKYRDFASGDRYENRIHPDQLDWLKKISQTTTLPTVIVSHKVLDRRKARA